MDPRAKSKPEYRKSPDLVFVVSLGIAVFLTVFAICFGDTFNKASDFLFAGITDLFSWLYLLVVFIFVIFVILVACSRYGDLKLGTEDSKPEYSTFSWFAMLFCAGMGVGLVFWGVSEPISHYIAPSGANGIEPGTADAAAFAFRSSFMHWGIHPWAAYAVVGLALAYFQFRKDRPCLMSSVIQPLISEKRMWRWVGEWADILASFATVAGIVTSLGLGVLQINSGLARMFGIPNTLVTQIVIIAIVSIIFMWSAVSGIDKGVKNLSNFNVCLAILLMVGAALMGPKVEILNNLVNGIGNYLGCFIQDSLNIPEYADKSWVEAWKVFYWAWWIAWAPFVGAFIARISKGRTIRGFVFGVVLAPTLASLIWFGIFGTLGIHLGMDGILSVQELQEVASIPESGLFTVFSCYPFGKILSLLALVLLCTFFITSADSGTFVLAMLSSGGRIDPPNYKKIIWGIVLFALSIGLLLSGGLKPLQTLSIVAAFPFMLLMVGACIALVKVLKEEEV